MQRLISVAARLVALPVPPRSDARLTARVWGLTLAAGVLVLLAFGAFAAAVGVSGSFLSREPQVVLDGPFYAGTLSNLGALVWMTSVVVAVVGWATSTERAVRRAFLAGAAIGLVLMVDDFFLVHDWVGGRSDRAGQLLVALYLLAAAALIIAGRRALGLLTVIGLTGAVSLWGLSVIFDEYFNGFDQLVEDGLKFLGICLWTATWTLRSGFWQLRAQGDPVEPPTGLRPR